MDIRQKTCLLIYVMESTYIKVSFFLQTKDRNLKDAMKYLIKKTYFQVLDHLINLGYWLSNVEIWLWQVQRFLEDVSMNRRFLTRHLDMTWKKFDSCYLACYVTSKIHSESLFQGSLLIQVSNVINLDYTRMKRQTKRHTNRLRNIFLFSFIVYSQIFL